MTPRTVAILRGFDTDTTADMAQRCWAAGFDLVEVPIQNAAGWLSLEAVAALADGRPFGAGTVLTPGDARRALGMGASTVISPAIDARVVEEVTGAGAVALPGVMTPTDVAHAALLGLRTCKMFPAGLLGAGWLGAMRGPFPGMAFVAVGGIGIGNAADFIRAGAAGVGFGGSVVDVLALEDPAAYVAELHELVPAGAAEAV